VFFLQGGKREIVLGIDDQLLKKAETEGTSRRIPRDDVAALAVAALTTKSADNRCDRSLSCNHCSGISWCTSAQEHTGPGGDVQRRCMTAEMCPFHPQCRTLALQFCRAVDAVAKDPGDGTPTTDFEGLFAGLSGNCKY
jgi:hypothetical protein